MMLTEEQVVLAQELGDKAVELFVQLFKMYRKDDEDEGICADQSIYDWLHECFDFDDLCAKIAAKMEEAP